MKRKRDPSPPTGMVRIDEKIYTALAKAAEIDKRMIRVVAMMAIEEWLNKNHPELLKD